MEGMGSEGERDFDQVYSESEEAPSDNNKKLYRETINSEYSM